MASDVSVVIPTYNRGRMVLRAALSALLQSVPPEEVIIVDDGSTDATAVLTEALERAAGERFESPSAIRCIRLPENRGANAARNAGITMARGERIAFLDSDDVWHPRKLALQSETIAASVSDGRPVFSYTGRFRVDEALRLVARQFARIGDPERLRRSNFIGPLSSVIVDLSLLQAIGGFDERLFACQDWDMFLRALPLSRPVEEPRPLLLYHDAAADRITLDHRKRIIAHLQIYRRHVRGHVRTRADLAELYRNLAEDFSEMGRRRSATAFYAAHLAARRHPLTARLVAALDWRRVKAKRYAGYDAARLSEARDPAEAAANGMLFAEAVGFAGLCAELAGAVAADAGRDLL